MWYPGRFFFTTQEQKKMWSLTGAKKKSYRGTSAGWILIDIYSLWQTSIPCVFYIFFVKHSKNCLVQE